jgi:hypothetical protein
MTEEELMKERARTEGARISYEFMKRHLTDYDRSERSAKILGDELKARGLDLSLDNLEKVFVDLKARGVSFTNAASAPAAPSASGEQTLEGLPEVLGMNPQVFTVADINNMDRERYKKLYFGPQSAAFRARVNEIIRRAKEGK